MKTTIIILGGIIIALLTGGMFWFGLAFIQLDLNPKDGGVIFRFAFIISLPLCVIISNDMLKDDKVSGGISCIKTKGK